MLYLVAVSAPSGELAVYEPRIDDIFGRVGMTMKRTPVCTL